MTAATAQVPRQLGRCIVGNAKAVPQGDSSGGLYERLQPKRSKAQLADDLLCHLRRI